MPGSTTVTLISWTGAVLGTCTCSAADAAALAAAIEAVWAGTAHVKTYTLPGSPARRINLAAVALYGPA